MTGFGQDLRFAIRQLRKNPTFACTAVLILAEAVWLTIVGIVVGAVGSIGAATLIRGLLFGVRARDVSTIGAVAAILALSALAASYVPARRAAQVEPSEALGYE